MLNLQVLEGVIKYRWNALPVEQRDGMKNYISEVIVKVLIFLPFEKDFTVFPCFRVAVLVGERGPDI